MVQNKNSYTQWPNEKGYFGDFGGRYVSETLMPLIEEVEQEYNSVDGHDVPIPHFGVILDWEQWHEFSNRIKDEIEFVIKPYIRFKGKTGEQATMFFLDPDNNALEFKAFKNDKMIFEK